MIGTLVHLLAVATMAGAAKPVHLENMKFLTSDTRMTCTRGDFILTLAFDGTGDNVDYAWNGQAGRSPVTWKNNVATFGLTDAQNGPFKLEFKASNFYFQNVLCVENFDDESKE